MSRQFYLTNSDGDTFDLMQSAAFFHSPSGLGLGRNQSFLRTGTIYALTDDYLSQKSINGEMIFRTYAKYTEFASFIAHAPLTMVYEPENTEYSIDCYVSKLDKSEIEKDTNRLICAITFTATTKWYVKRGVMQSSTETEGMKIYPYEYDYKYADTSVAVIEGTNNSSQEAPCILHIIGPVTNPAWNLVVDSQTIQNGSLTGSIPSGDKLVVNSRDDSLEVAEYTTADVYVQNRYKNTNYSSDVFLYIPSGAFKIQISDDGASEITAYLELIEEYDTV